MTAQLAVAFDHVVALDVSTEQLRLAQEFLGERAARVTFHRVDGTEIPLPDSSAAGMFSSHVFQHFSSFGMIVDYLRESLRVLAPGGTVCFHVPVSGAHRKAHRSVLRRGLSTVSAKLKRALGQRRLREYHVYSAHQVLGAMQALGFSDTELRVFDMSSNRDAHSFFLARKT